MQDATTAEPITPAGERPTPLLLREDTILGVCEAIGRDFGFNPLWLRIALAAGLLVNAYAVVGIYFGLGVLVAITRIAMPDKRKPAPVAETASADAPQAANEREPELIAA